MSVWERVWCGVGAGREVEEGYEEGRRKGEEDEVKRGRLEGVEEGMGWVGGRVEGGGRTVKVAPEGRMKC